MEEDNPKVPATIALLCGASAIGWMLWHHGIKMLSQWFFYPSLAFSAILLIWIMSNKTHRWMRWGLSLCKWWSAFWSAVFILAMIAPPLSQLIVGTLMFPVVQAASIHPFLAGFAHVLIWSCVREVCKQTANPTEHSQS